MVYHKEWLTTALIWGQHLLITSLSKMQQLIEWILDASLTQLCCQALLQVKANLCKCNNLGGYFLHRYQKPRQGFWYFAEKKAKFRGIFRGKFAEKSADFAGFSREKSQNSRNNRPISGNFCGRKAKIRKKIGPFRGILAEKSQFLKDFQGQILRKIGSREISVGNFTKKQSVKNSRFRWGFFGQISLKSINFASIWPALVNVFF